MSCPDMHRPRNRTRVLACAGFCALAGLALVALPAFAQGVAAPWE